jgi:hypothetical protein
MSKPSRLFAVIALSVAAVVCGSYAYNSAVAQDKDKPKEKASTAEIAKWEYRIVVVGLDGEAAQKELNQLGEQGFEIAFVTGSHKSQANFRGAGGVAEASRGWQHVPRRVVPQPRPVVGRQ